MKNMFKRLLVLMAGVLLISLINVKGTPLLVKTIKETSIRTQGVQGLRYSARFAESVKNNEHGFYLIYGEASILELEDVINNSVNGVITLNEKVVFKVVIPGVTRNNTFFF